MKKISISCDIAETINKILYAIDEYKNETGKICCLHMNDDTIRAITIPVVGSSEKEYSHDKLTGFVGKWEGTKIIIDNSLNFGEIEIKQDEQLEKKDDAEFRCVTCKKELTSFEHFLITKDSKYNDVYMCNRCFIDLALNMLNCKEAMMNENCDCFLYYS